MKVKYDPNKNLEARMIRQLFDGRDEVKVGEICKRLSLNISDFSEVLMRLEEFQLATNVDYPLTVDSRILLCKHDLIIGKVYDVLLVAFGSYRILSEGSVDHGNKPEPYQYHRELFVVTDSRIPNNWVGEWVDGELSIHPPGWNNTIISDFFENQADARKRFIEGLAQYFPGTYQKWMNHESNGNSS